MATKMPLPTWSSQKACQHIGHLGLTLAKAKQLRKTLQQHLLEQQATALIRSQVHLYLQYLLAGKVRIVRQARPNWQTGVCSRLLTASLVLC
jgi:hypothetical protein